MRLMDCYIELIAYVSYLLKSAATSHASLEQVKTDINQLIAKCDDNFHKSRLPQEDYDLSRFAIFAWIDEAILSSSWQEKGKWQSEQLQRTYYQTTDGGELFFDKLNQLTPQQEQVREVYYLCLSLGFSGRYCNPGDEFLLEQLKNSNLKLLGGSPDQYAMDEEVLFPSAYLRGRTRKRKESAKGKRFPLALLFGATAPLLLYGMLFFIYRFILDNVGTNFLNSVQ